MQAIFAFTDERTFGYACMFAWLKPISMSKQTIVSESDCMIGAIFFLRLSLKLPVEDI